MPCYSVVTETKITDSARLMSVLSQLGVKVQTSNSLYIESDLGTFQRRSEDSAFTFSGTRDQLAPVGRKYAEATAREWAIRNGMSVVENTGIKMTLQKRR